METSLMEVCVCVCAYHNIIKNLSKFKFVGDQRLSDAELAIEQTVHPI